MIELFLLVAVFVLVVSVFATLVGTIITWKEIARMNQRRLDQMQKLVKVVAEIYSHVQMLPELRDKMTGLTDSLIDDAISEDDDE